MPNIPQTELSKPKSWDEFEDIVWDLYTRVWQDPHAQRYGRSGQPQHGVDIYGQPHDLGGRYAGIQCKRYAEGTLTRKKVEAEVAKAEAFSPPLAEYVIATTEPRDAELQEVVRQFDQARQAAGKFRVRIVFWESLCNQLTHPDNRDLLQKHYGDWISCFRDVACEQIPPHRADIHVELVEHGFGRSYGTRRSPFRGIPRNPNGFNTQGLPDWGTLWARIKFKNKGREEGGLKSETDQYQVKLPPLFDSNNTRVEFFPPRVVAGRTETGSYQFFFDVLFSEHDPRAFAEALRALVDSKQRYRLVIPYQTHCVDGDSDARELIIEGDFLELYQSVLDYWDGYGFRSLADLARPDEPQHE
jgi:hypothetical protein